jgi:hypothetical protein
MAERMKPVKPVEPNVLHAQDAHNDTTCANHSSHEKKHQRRFSIFLNHVIQATLTHKTSEKTNEPIPKCFLERNHAKHDKLQPRIIGTFVYIYINHYWKSTDRHIFI